MDILHRVCDHIHSLSAGEQWQMSAQKLWISRMDFHALSVFLAREAQKGHFSIASEQDFQALVLTVTKH